MATNEGTTAQTTRIDEVLERATDYYEQFLWRSENTQSVRARLADLGLDESILKEFRVGYAPSDWDELLQYLSDAGFQADELVTAGVTGRSDRGRLHVQFRSRIMFPLVGEKGRIDGLAGLATNPGPSWPLWTTTPESERFSRASAMFGLDRAREEIGRSGRVVVLGDCLEVIALHAKGETNSVAVIRSNVRAGHLARLAGALGGSADEIGAVEDSPEQGAGVRAVYALGGAPPAGAVAEADAGPEPSRARRGIIPHAVVVRPPAAIAAINVARLALGLGVPLLWLQLMGFETDTTENSEPVFVASIACVAATYAALAVLSAFFSGRVRARWTARPMRLPWERGSTEWQPPAWTYHALEDIMIGAAIVSVFVCLGLFFTIGGFV